MNLPISFSPASQTRAKRPPTRVCDAGLNIYFTYVYGLPFTKFGSGANAPTKPVRTNTDTMVGSPRKTLVGCPWSGARTHRLILSVDTPREITDPFGANKISMKPVPSLSASWNGLIGGSALLGTAAK